MFEFSSIDRYHSWLKEEGSCVQAVQHYLDRIGSNKHLNAFIEVYTSEALATARDLDDKRSSGKTMGKLHGVVIGIKDVICYKDHRISASSKILPEFISVYSATAVQRLLDEEAIIIGNLNCDEFAMGSTNENSAYGPVLNAIDETRIPGGSSGGSAVAVQAGLCMVSLGSDTGGSVRQPADLCGIIGLKPTYGRVSRYGLIAYASSFDSIGIFGTRIADVGLTLEVIAGHDEFDSTVSSEPVPQYSLPAPSKKYRIAYLDTAVNHPSLDPEIRTAVNSSLELLRQNGHLVEPVAFDLIDHIVPAYYVLTTAEASSNLSRFDGIKYGYRVPGNPEDLTDLYKRSRSEGFGLEVKRRIMLGTFVLSSGYYDAYFTRAQKVRKLLYNQIQLIFKEYDFIVIPTTPSTAFRLGEKMEDPIAMYLADIYTVTANLAGIPAISIPLFRHSNGLPFGLQVMANQFCELSLLTVSQDLLNSQQIQ
ncbi:MAG: Asp-tRNA(Asn)/Glu-tRNA(Gln) amidotransferase subunit GatA [Chitinophagaceae bacterium]|nr:MAG: Asp-tRNA(Asn)/Glu-tRNA(Gln) amidotransferase subunit GatA [Chitinophagaceae bacterium]